jgi:ketosteroid isomerase-like protein
MTKHPHIQILEQFYAHFTPLNISKALELCTETFTFQIAGKSKLSGKFNKNTFAHDFMNRAMELSNGTFKFEVHDILASDLHATVLASSKVTRGDKTVELRTVHVWRFENGKPLAGYEYPRDLYAFDAIWF